MTKLVYIGGYGHSGSTLLEYLLAASPDAVACGEVASVLRDRDRKGKCTCRRPIRECPVWGPLFASPGTLDGMSHESLSRALVAQDGDAHAILIDSTKTAWRSAAVPFRLASALGGDFALVHLVRDPRAVAWSGVKKAGRRGARPLLPLRSASAALGWWIANLACEAFGAKYPDRYVRLRYEDLARAPDDEMQGLFVKLVPQSKWSADGIGANDNRHQLYGNRMRSGEPVSCRGQGRCRVAARHAAPRPLARLAAHRSASLALRLRLSRGNARRECALLVGVTVTRRSTMPAKSAAQQKAAGAALSAKRGKTSPSKLKGASRSMYKSMSEKQLDEFASTKRKGKPEHVARPRTKKSASRSTARKSPARKGTARKTAARKGPSRRTSSR